MPRRALLGFGFFTLLSACSLLPTEPAPAPQTTQAVPDEPGRQHVGIVDKDGKSALGFSLVPPDEPGWTQTREKLGINLQKPGTLAEENQQIEAYIMNMDIPLQPLERFIAQIKNNIEQGYAKDPDFKLQEVQVAAYAGNPQCVKSHILLQDLRDKSSKEKWSEQYVLSCGSAKYRRFGFEVRYYQRYFTGNRDSALDDKAERVFASFRIEDK